TAGRSGLARSGPLVLRARATMAVVGGPVRRRLRRPPDPEADAAAGAAVLLGAALALVVGPAGGLVAGGLCVAVPAMARRGQRRRGEVAVRRVLPDVVDLFRLAAGAGLSVHQAVDAVGA